MRPEAVAELPQVPSFNTPDHQGLTPLMYALRWGHLETAAVLLPFVDKSSVDNHRRTALHIAVMSGMSIDQAKAIKLLLFNPGIDINAQDDMGRTALHWAAWLGQSDSVVALMAERPGPLPGVDVSIRDNSGYKAECLAKAKNYYKIESLLRSNPRSHAYIRHYQGAPSRISVPLPIRAQLTGQTADRGPSSVRGWDPTESVASTVYVGGDGSVAPESAVGGPGEGSKGPGCRHRVGQALKWALRLDPTRRR